MSSIFGGKKETKTATNSTQSGATQNNLFDNAGFQNFLQGYSNQYGDINVPVDPTTQQAALNQSGVAGQLGPGFQTAGQVASGNGYNAQSYQPYMSEYTGQVTDALQTQFGDLMKQAGQVVNGDMTKQGALGNSNNAVARANAMTPIMNQAQTKLAEVQQQGFNTANQNAQAATNAQLQGVSALGNMAGAATGANAGAGQIGNTVFNQQLAPYTLANQGAQGWGNLGNIAGTNYQGQSTGNSKTTETQTDSPFKILSTLVGTAMSLSDERVKENIAPVGEAFDGQTIYRYNYKGDPRTQIGLIAQDVEKTNPEAVGEIGGVKAVDYGKATEDAAERGGFAGGGEVVDLDALLMGYFQAKAMAEAGQAQGGERQQFESGGRADLGDHDPRMAWIDGPNKFALPVDELRTGYLPTRGERIRDAILDYGPMPAKMLVDEFGNTTDAIARTIEDPSIPNLGESAVRSAMLLGRPMGAIKAMAGAYGAAGAADVGSKFMGRAEAADPRQVAARLNAMSPAEIKALQRQLGIPEDGRVGPMTVNAAVAQETEKERAAASSSAERIAIETARAKADAEARARQSIEGARAGEGRIDTAKKVLAEDLMKAKTPAKDETYTGQLYDKLGVLTPLVAGIGGGMAARAARPVVGFSPYLKDTSGTGSKVAAKLADDYLLPALGGAEVGATVAMAPTAAQAMRSDPANPEYAAWQKYSLGLPADAAEEIARAEKRLKEVPPIDPAVTQAKDDIKDWRVWGGNAIRGALGGLSGNMLAAAAGRIPKGINSTTEELAQVPGSILTGYQKSMDRASKARATSGAARQLDGEVAQSSAAQQTRLQDASRTADEARLLEQGAAPRGASSALTSEGPAFPPFPGLETGPGKVIDGSVSKPAPQLLERAKDPMLTRANVSSQQKSSAPPPGYENHVIPDGYRWVHNGKGSILHDEHGNFAPLSAARLPDKKDTASSSTKRKAKLDDPAAEYFERNPGALKGQRDGGEVQGYANGGEVPPHEPIITGSVIGSTGGREDALPVSVPAGSFVIPADCVAALGGNNSLAGHKALDQHFGKSDPSYSQGGSARTVPIKISDGEHVLGPDQVTKIGGGNPEMGHRILDAFVLKVRKHHIDTLKKLPAPSK